MAMNATGAGGMDEDLEILGARALGPQDPEAVGRYRICALLGNGGMGRVYLGRRRNSDETPVSGGIWVAVKVIRPDLADSPEFRRRFARELEAVRRVHSPYAAALVHGDAESQQPWIATEYVPGVSLSDAVFPGEPLPASSVWRLAHDLASALVVVHQAGIVHRDVKPSNVILAGTGAKIIDFGVAYASHLSQLTATGVNIGTPSFMAPEQARAGEAAPASDVFSLGVLLYFAATGRLPFGEGGTAEVLFRIVYEEPDLDALATVEPALRDLVLRCISKDPRQRPSAAEALATARAATTAGALSPDEAAPWPEALAARISERTRAAGRTLSDVSDREPTRAAAPELSSGAAPFGFESGPAPIPVPAPILSADVNALAPSRRPRRFGFLVAAVAGAVLAFGVAAFIASSRAQVPGAAHSAVNAAIVATTASFEASAAPSSPGVVTHTPSVASSPASPTPSTAPTLDSAPALPTTSGASSSATKVSLSQQTIRSTPSASPTVAATTPASCGTLASNRALFADQMLASCNGAYVLNMQDDGNLVLYNAGKAVWASETGGSGADKAAMQSDGNFVLYTSAGSVAWFSGTAGNPGAYLSVQNDGDLAVVSTSGGILWSTGTGGQ